MPVELKVPEVGESITEVEIGRWLKQEGDTVAKDDPIVEIETDKVTLELPAPAAGVITQQGKKQGEAASVGDVIGLMEEGDAPAAGPEAEKKQPADAQAAAKPAEADQPEPAKAQRDAAAPAAHAPVASKTAGRGDGNGPVIMPAARRLLEEHGLEPDEVEPTGPGGRLLKEDVQRHVDRLASRPPKSEDQPRAKPAPAPAVSTEPGREEEAVPMSPMRRRIAQRLVEAQQTAALLTTFNEIDMSAVMALRNQHKQAFADRYGIKLGFMSFFVKAAIDALKQFPAINAEVRDTTIVYKNYYDIGIAVGTGKGLVVPVLRNAERMSFAQVENTIAEFGQKVKENRLGLEEMQGGTFTITNGGVFGSLLSTPIVNPPQSAVLGMHAIQDRPVAIDGRVEVRPMMYVALTYDHRLVDGREAVSFLVRIKQALEDPARMLMEV